MRKNRLYLLVATAILSIAFYTSQAKAKKFDGSAWFHYVSGDKTNPNSYTWETDPSSCPSATGNLCDILIATPDGITPNDRW